MSFCPEELEFLDWYETRYRMPFDKDSAWGMVSLQAYEAGTLAALKHNVNLQSLLKTAQDAVAIYSKRITDAAILLARLDGHELGVHRSGSGFPGTEYYTSWDDGEYYIKQALSKLMGET